MEQDRCLHFPHSLHFTDNMNKPDMMDKNPNRLWMIRNLFEILNIFSKFCSPSTHLTILTYSMEQSPS
jgi:hypothetical protein